MAKRESQSLRVRRAEQQARRRRQQRIYYALAAAAVLMVVALFAIIRQANAPQLEDVVMPESLEVPPGADGKAWGPADAPVVVEEYADFQ
jgi:hypothetical protein